MEIAYLQHTHNENGILWNEVVASDHRFRKASNLRQIHFVSQISPICSILNESPLDGYLIQGKIFNRFPLFQDYMSIDGTFSI